MTKQDIVTIYGVLKATENCTDPKDNSSSMTQFRYAVARNITLIKPEIEALTKAAEPKVKYKEYDNKRIALCVEHANKDERKKPIIKGNMYDLFDESGDVKKEFTTAWEALKIEYKEFLDEHDIQLAEYDKLLQEPITVPFYQIKLEYFPSDIPGDAMDFLLPLIDGPK